MSADAPRGLFAALNQAGADPVCLRALADWFEEHDDLAAAACLRWLVEAGRRHGHSANQTSYGKFFWEREAPDPLLGDTQALLPEALWLALANNDEPHPVSCFKSYRSAEAAYRALIAAWKRAGAPP